MYMFPQNTMGQSVIKVAALQIRYSTFFLIMTISVFYFIQTTEKMKFLKIHNLVSDAACNVQRKELL